MPLALCMLLGGCALHWPWRHRPAPAPQPVHELTIQPNAAPDAPDAAAAGLLAQYWDRNALLLDLTALHGQGAITLTPDPARGWPIRLELRVQPGGIARVEVSGGERVVFEVPGQGKALVLKVPPEVYVRGTAGISLRWSAAADSAH
jgi:hypothetical protein